MALTKNCWEEPFVLRRFTLQEEDLTNTNEGCEADVQHLDAFGAFCHCMFTW